MHSGSLIPSSFYFPTPEKVDSLHPAITKPFLLLLLAAVTFAIMSYNVTGILRSCLVPSGTGVKLAFSYP